MEGKTRVILIFTVWISLLLNRSKSVKLTYRETFQKFYVTRPYIFGYPLKINVLTCQCNCDYDIAMKFYDKAKPAFDKECEDKAMFNAQTFCFTKYQMLSAGNQCTSKHSMCVVNVTLVNLYKAMQLLRVLTLNRYNVTKCDYRPNCPVISTLSKFKAFSIGKELFNQAIKEGNQYNNKTRYFFIKLLSNGTNIWSGDSISELSELDYSKPGWFQTEINNTHCYKRAIENLQRKLIFESGICDSGLLSNWTTEAFGIINENKRDNTSRGFTQLLESGSNLTVRRINFTANWMRIFHYLPITIKKIGKDVDNSKNQSAELSLCCPKFGPNLSLKNNDSLEEPPVTSKNDTISFEIEIMDAQIKPSYLSANIYSVEVCNDCSFYVDIEHDIPSIIATTIAETMAETNRTHEIVIYVLVAIIVLLAFALVGCYIYWKYRNPHDASDDNGSRSNLIENDQPMASTTPQSPEPKYQSINASSTIIFGNDGTARDIEQHSSVNTSVPSQTHMRGSQRQTSRAHRRNNRFFSTTFLT